ncbi:unnamed protein product [Caenorhabditis bovis]|uniref:Uncharacterized protein n=1 Tax=Caenorhabditis bovis TaxID=2654633 RepID=A0A8S1EJT6_9PELO|nr:unnamed protein product [Caenorhabditis bovis]
MNRSIFFGKLTASLFTKLLVMLLVVLFFAFIVSVESLCGALFRSGRSLVRVGNIESIEEIPKRSVEVQEFVPIASSSKEESRSESIPFAGPRFWF